MDQITLPMRSMSSMIAFGSNIVLEAVADGLILLWAGLQLCLQKYTALDLTTLLKRKLHICAQLKNYSILK